MAANGEVSLELPVARLHIDESMGDGVNTEITLVDDATGAPIEGAWVFVAAEVDGARIDLGDLQSDHDGRAHDRITAAARYTVRTAGPFTPRAPHVAFYEKTNLVVEPIDGLVRATIRLHRKP
jgi:hypothetical protein